MPRRLLFLAASCFAAACLSSGGVLAQQAPQNDTDDGPQPKSAAYADLVRTDQPVACWRFDDDKGTAELNGSPWRPTQIGGSPKLSQPGPGGPQFPLFEAGNRAAVFEKAGSLRYDD